MRGGPDHPLPAIIDGEGMVVRGAGVWVASEGRRTPKRQAQLLRFDAASGRLTLSLPLPDDWQPAPARGLPSNGGPESLALLQVEDQPDVLLLAAELPLLQDRPDRVRLLALRLPLPRPAPSSPLFWTPLTPLRLPGPGWGLTDLLVVPAAASASTGAAAGRGPSLLALLRRFEAPDQWQARLALYPIPAPLPPDAAGPSRSAPIPPQASWDLLRPSLLPPDNWEAIINGPPLPDGRPSFVLASDDNFNPFQDNHLAQIAPRRMGACRSSP